MRTILDHGTFEQTLEAASLKVQELAHGLRKLIIKIYPEVTEVPWPKQRITGYGVGPRKMSEHFAYIGAFKQHVNLGFYYGADLPDPQGLLEGSGKKLRHLKIQRAEQIHSPAVSALIQASIRERIEALGQH